MSNLMFDPHINITLGTFLHFLHTPANSPRNPNFATALAGAVVLAGILDVRNDDAMGDKGISIGGSGFLTGTTHWTG